MKATVRKAKMCKSKLSFRTKAVASKVAAKHGQTVYECPICFCFHCTSKTSWRDEFVGIEEYNKAVRELEEYRTKYKKERQRLGDEISKLHTIIQTKKQLIKELREDCLRGFRNNTSAIAKIIATKEIEDDH